MTNYALLVAGAALLTTSAFVTSGANATKPSVASLMGEQTTLDKKRTCKAGYRYSKAKKRCVKRQKRGSY